MSNHFTIGSAQVGFGQLGLDGRLGYDCPETAGKAIVSGALSYDEIISAHAPSSLAVQFQGPVEVCAALAISGFADGVRCYIDDHWIGTLGNYSRRTPWIRLIPGAFRLESTISGNAHGAHVVWLIRTDTNPPPQRVAVVCHAYYPRARLDAVANILFRTAAHHGVHVCTAGVDQPWKRFSSKVVETAKVVQRIPDAYDCICVVDIADVLVVANEAEIGALLCEKALIAAEPCAWPLREANWTSQFAAPTMMRFPNSGVIGGPRAIIQELYQYAVETLDALRHRRLDGRFNQYGHWWWDDQFVWQSVFLRRREALHVDYDNRLALSLGCVGGNVIGNPLGRAEACRVVSQFGTRPVFLHMCGQAGSHIALWYRSLFG